MLGCRRTLVAATVLIALTSCSSGGRGSATPQATGPTIATTGATATTTPAAPSAAHPCGSSGRPSDHYAHVIWIWMENKSFGQVVESQSAPYINALVATCGLATNYRSVTHPSLPNYLASVSGTTGGVTSDCSPSSCPQSARTLFQQLTDARLSWRAYNESMPSNCAPNSAGNYAARHNPATYYPALRSACRDYDLPLPADVPPLASFNFITPNLCHDMHDCSVAVGDQWLASWVPKILASRAYRAGSTVVFITWDEGAGNTTSSCLTSSASDCHVATIVISPSTPAGARSSTPFSHYSLLRTTEELLGLPFLGHASSAASMRAAFGL